MPKNDQNEDSTSILAKVGDAASGAGSFLGRGAKALFGGIIPTTIFAKYRSLTD